MKKNNGERKQKSTKVEMDHMIHEGTLVKKHVWHKACEAREHVQHEALRHGSTKGT